MATTAATPAPSASKGRTAPFSTHARGVPLFDKARFFDIPRHIARSLLDLRDISSSGFWFAACQAWYTLWGALITLVSVTFFSLYNVDSEGRPELAADLDWTLISFTVVLPLVGLVFACFWRRERSLRSLSTAKALMLEIYWAHSDWLPPQPAGGGGGAAAAEPLAHAPNHAGGGNAEAADVRFALLGLLATLRCYLSPPRFYSRYYPFLGFRATMVQIAVERTRHLRALRDALRTLGRANVAQRAAGLPPALEAALHARCGALHAALLELSNVKEYGTPQGIRTLARLYVMLIIPLFFGPYWAWVSFETDFAFAFFFSILLEVALVGVLNVSLALEDPFDNVGMGGVFVDEAFAEVEQALSGDHGPPPQQLGLGTNGGTPHGGSASGSGGPGGRGVVLEGVANMA